MMKFWIKKLGYYAVLIRANRPIGFFLLLWPALWAIWLASKGQPPLKIVIIFSLGVVLMRSAGCAINDYADRHIDGLVERTKNRPLVAGLITAKEALMVFFILILAAFVLVLQLDQKTILLSIVAAVLATLYPFMKRWTYLPQLVLGMAFGWAIPMAFMAILGELPLITWLLYLSAIIWALIYDTQYAMVDRADDIKIGVKSTAILFAQYDRLIIALLQLIMMVILVIVGYLYQLNFIYYLALVVATSLFIYQQWLIKNRVPALCFKAFLNNNLVGLVIFIGILGGYLKMRLLF